MKEWIMKDPASTLSSMPEHLYTFINLTPACRNQIYRH